jgi:hypothetical protein
MSLTQTEADSNVDGEKGKDGKKKEKEAPKKEKKADDDEKAEVDSDKVSDPKSDS